MATFYANPNDTHDPWIEQAAFNGFRNWHLMFFCFSSLVVLVILICCCLKFRIPRTKQEIEGDYRRKKLAEKFQERLRQIQNQDMDVLDLQQALKLIQEDFDQENAKIALEPQQGESIEPAEPQATQQPKFAKKFADIMLAAKHDSNNPPL
ncbi:transmembrane inner ear expressed protein [Asbolus verrucosus]|uniref:Transmembrane inner ear expressed protein n=1 Tax=Asbolus verrucosus TaxID=1661398 RepID=A0A482W675_ASBVE|nr:transmembrane inner ear expressed protein [Asbolus verrucosus]